MAEMPGALAEEIVPGNQRGRVQSLLHSGSGGASMAAWAGSSRIDANFVRDFSRLP